jgi:hypothetical protein
MTLRLTMKVQPHFNLVSLLGAPTSALRIALYVCNRLVTYTFVMSHYPNTDNFL